MATAQIPPTGGIYEAEKRRQNQIREMYSLDPVERWRLREQRISGNLVAVSQRAISQAQDNGLTFQKINSMYKEI